MSQRERTPVSKWIVTESLKTLHETAAQFQTSTATNTGQIVGNLPFSLTVVNGQKNLTAITLCGSNNPFGLFVNGISSNDQILGQILTFSGSHTIGGTFTSSCPK